jgi:hypothetical protein
MVVDPPRRMEQTGSFRSRVTTLTAATSQLGKEHDRWLVRLRPAVKEKPSCVVRVEFQPAEGGLLPGFTLEVIKVRKNQRCCVRPSSDWVPNSQEYPTWLRQMRQEMLMVVLLKLRLQRSKPEYFTAIS